MELNQDNLKKFTQYDPLTGVFKRTARLSWKGNVVKCDFVPKSKTHYGYFQINMFGQPCVVHRLIFLYMTGSLPVNDVDHINGDRTDNRWCNLRDVERMENLHNMGVRKDNTSGCVGVSLRKDTGKHYAYIEMSNERHHLGDFNTKEEAINARKQAEVDFGYHVNHGKREAHTL